MDGGGDDGAAFLVAGTVATLRVAVREVVGARPVVDEGARSFEIRCSSVFLQLEQIILLSRVLPIENGRAIFPCS